MDESLQGEFDSVIDILCQHESVKSLYIIKQHGDVNRLTHCLNVAERSFLVGKMLGLDCKVITKAGFLHDFHHDGRFSIKERRKSKVFSHASVAVINARKLFGLNKKEINIIRSHMFPLSLIPPKSLEAVVVNCMDKWSTVFELYDSWFRPARQKKRDIEVYNRYVK